MQSISDIWLEQDERDADEAAAGDGLDASIQFDAASGRVTFHVAWAVPDDASSTSPVCHSIVLVLEAWTMERYAALEDDARLRVHALLRDKMRRMAERLPDPGRPCTLTVELTDAMLDAACLVQ